MRTPTKIILLVLFVVIAVGAILIFVKTQVAPPGNVAFTDQFSAPLNQEVERIGTNPFPGCRSDFEKASHKIAFMNAEKMLTPEQSDGIKMKINTTYGDKVVDYANGMFSSSNWPDDNIKLISSSITGLRQDRLHNGQSAITSELDGKFRQVEGVIGDYRTAMAFAKNSSFKSVADASSRINSIDIYRNKPYLSNNAALMTALNNLPANIANSHYNYVVAQIKKLGGYNTMSETYFYDTLVPQVERSIDEYSATDIYGSKKSSDGLYDLMQGFLDRAYNYYNSSYNYDQWL